MATVRTKPLLTFRIPVVPNWKKKAKSKALQQIEAREKREREAKARRTFGPVSPIKRLQTPKRVRAAVKRAGDPNPAARIFPGSEKVPILPRKRSRPAKPTGDRSVGTGKGPKLVPTKGHPLGPKARVPGRAQQTSGTLPKHAQTGAVSPRKVNQPTAAARARAESQGKAKPKRPVQRPQAPARKTGGPQVRYVPDVQVAEPAAAGPAGPAAAGAETGGVPTLEDFLAEILGPEEPEPTSPFANMTPEQLVKMQFAPEYQSIDTQQKRAMEQATQHQNLIAALTTQLGGIMQGSTGEGSMPPALAAAMGQQALAQAQYAQHQATQQFGDQRAQLASQERSALYQAYNDQMTAREQERAGKVEQAIAMRKMYLDEHGAQWDRDYKLAQLENTAAKNAAELDIKYSALQQQTSIANRTLGLKNRTLGLNVTKTKLQHSRDLAKLEQQGMIAADRSKYQWARLSQTQKRDRVDALLANQRVNIQLEELGLKSAAEKRKWAELELNRAGKGLTPAQLLRLKQDAGATARDAYLGVAATSKDPEGMEPLGYQIAIRDMLAAGVPLSVAQQALNRYYKPGERGRPVWNLQQRKALGIPTGQAFNPKWRPKPKPKKKPRRKRVY